MCGIAGVKSRDSIEQRATAVERMLKRMSYRGPDNAGIFSHKSLSFGNVRLAIQGVDPSGNQPIFNEDRTVVTVFNGEIYNHHELRKLLLGKGHRFSSSTDTELLVHLYEDYGEEFGEMLNGMFAFAIFDSKHNRLLLGRDRIGQKPLFVYSDENLLAFSSEIKSLLTVIPTPKIQMASVSEYLELGYVLEPNTILENVRTVMPGTVEIFEDGNHRTKQFWRPSVATFQHTDIEEWLEEATPTFFKAVDRHLLSDVPVSLLLSGGVDSSLVLALTSSQNSIHEVFTGSFQDCSDHDEFPYASRLANAFGKSCNRIDLSSKILAELLPEYLQRLPQPSGDYSGLATYALCKQVSKHYRVVLGGDGGDELFGGYPTYRLPGLQRKYWFIPQLAVSTGWRVSNWLCDRNGYLSLPFQLQQLAQAWGQPNAKAHFEIKCFLPKIARTILNPLFQHDTSRGASRFSQLYTETPTELAAANRLAIVDLQTFLLSGTIPKLERTSMLSSLEARLPFLDNTVIELSEKTPWRLRYHQKKQKYPLRILFDRICKSNGITLKKANNPRKQGFSPPLRLMLSTCLKSWRDDTLSTESPVFVANLVERIDQLQAIGFDTHRLEWNICTLNCWLHDNKISA